MSLFLETLVISLLMAFFCLAPRLFRSVRDSSQVLLLVGTGALLGLYCFDLLPEILEVGGRSSVLIVLAVWLLYTLAHSFHLHHHHTGEDGHDHEVGFLMTSMVTHCLASGMFLVLSEGLSHSAEHTVFLAMLAHKGYEALSVSMVLQDKVREPRRLAWLTAIYALSFPAGVLLTHVALAVFQGPEHLPWMRTGAIVVASIAAGSLMGCMVHDFVIPSLRQVRRRRAEVAWLALGMLTTLAMTSAL